MPLCIHIFVKLLSNSGSSSITIFLRYNLLLQNARKYHSPHNSLILSPVNQFHIQLKKERVHRLPFGRRVTGPKCSCNFTRRKNKANLRKKSVCPCVVWFIAEPHLMALFINKQHFLNFCCSSRLCSHENLATNKNAMALFFHIWQIRLCENLFKNFNAGCLYARHDLCFYYSLYTGKVYLTADMFPQKISLHFPTRGT